jgi:hypothetical protein
VSPRDVNNHVDAGERRLLVDLLSTLCYAVTRMRNERLLLGGRRWPSME